MSVATFPVHDESGRARIEREALCRRLTGGCFCEQTDTEPIRRYLWVCISDSLVLNWHTTSVPQIAPEYRGLPGWIAECTDLDTGEKLGRVRTEALAP